MVVRCKWSSTYTNNGTTTINGTFQLNNGGYASGTALSYAATGSSLVLIMEVCMVLGL
jgi:hypothetical protein